jgi:ribosomal protein S18 acetylase RimI-like enzyme
VEITQAAPDRLPVLASLFGRAFVGEPMMAWPLGVEGDLVERLAHAFGAFLERVIPLGGVWEAGPGMGASIWMAPHHADAWEEATDNARRHVPSGEGERRWDTLWGWVESKIPEEPLWHFDSLAVEPAMQGRGIGSALIESGLSQVGADECVFLETGTARNVPLYERFGFRVVEDADMPEGGPHVWFMRRDP